MTGVDQVHAMQDMLRDFVRAGVLTGWYPWVGPRGQMWTVNRAGDTSLELDYDGVIDFIVATQAAAL